MQGYWMALLGTGEQVTDENGKWIVASQGILDTLNLYKTIYVDEGLGDQRAQLLADGRNRTFANFRDGKTAMLVEGDWFYRSVTAPGSEFAVADRDTVMTWKKMPAEEPGAGMRGQDFVTVSGGTGWVLNPNTDAPAEAWELLAFMNGKEQLEALPDLPAAASAPATTCRSPNSPFLTETSQTLLPLTTARPNDPHYNDVSAAIQRMTEAVVSGEMSPEDAMAAVQGLRHRDRRRGEHRQQALTADLAMTRPVYPGGVLPMPGDYPVKRFSLLSGRAGAAFMTPAALLVGAFVIVPFFWVIFVSFTNRTLLGRTALHPEFVGLDNYIALFDPDGFLTRGQFGFSLILTVQFVILSALFGQALLGMLLAWLIQSVPKGVKTLHRDRGDRRLDPARGGDRLRLVRLPRLRQRHAEHDPERRGPAVRRLAAAVSLLGDRRLQHLARRGLLDDALQLGLRLDPAQLLPGRRGRRRLLLAEVPRHRACRSSAATW